MGYTIDQLKKAFVDVLDGNSDWNDIHYTTGLPEKRCKEIEALFNKVVNEIYR